MPKHPRTASPSKSPPYQPAKAIKIIVPTPKTRPLSITSASVQRTLRTRAMLMGLKQKQRPKEPNTNKKPDRMRRTRPVLDAETFGIVHGDIAARMEVYRERNYRNKVELPAEIWEQMERKATKYMFANNMRSRVEFARIAHVVLKPVLLEERRPMFWITLTPDQYAFSFEDACEFETMKLQKWTQQVLPGLSFVGVVEGGCFPVQYASHSRIAVSYHAHLVGWGLSETEVNKLKADINGKYPAFIKTSPCAHAVRMQPTDILKRVFYMSKAPLKEMRHVPHLETIDRETGEVTVRGQNRNFKRPIRTGHFANMCRVMDGRTLDKLAFCAGEGKPLLKTIRHRALSAYRWEEERREARTRR